MLTDEEQTILKKLEGRKLVTAGCDRGLGVLLEFDDGTTIDISASYEDVSVTVVKPKGELTQ
jgi:hypothetical protein